LLAKRLRIQSEREKKEEDPTKKTTVGNKKKTFLPVTDYKPIKKARR
jgi:hypothetical protein